MCLAIFKPANVSIPRASLALGFQNNSDGAGFAFVAKGKVEIVKGLMTLKDFFEAYDKAFADNPKSPFLVHFRIRTMGFRDAENTHPFNLPNGGALIHNGGLNGTGAVYNNGPSDTALFVQKFGDKLTFKNVKQYKAELESAIGYNKIAMLYPDGKHLILNEKDGTWEDDVWYSNHTFKPRPSGVPNRSYYGGMYDDADWGETYR